MKAKWDHKNRQSNVKGGGRQENRVLGFTWHVSRSRDDLWGGRGQHKGWIRRAGAEKDEEKQSIMTNVYGNVTIKLT